MPSPGRAPLLIALAALVLAAFPLLAFAQTVTRATGDSDTPSFLDTWREGPDAATAAPPTPASPSPTPVRITPSNAVIGVPKPSESETPANSSVDMGAGNTGGAAPTGVPGRANTKPWQTLIDQYPANPRCYVGGHYFPAPPLCPN